MHEFEYPVVRPFELFGKKIQNVRHLIQKYPTFILKCRLIPPKNLVFPLIPIRVYRKDVGIVSCYSLCKKCAEIGKKTVCKHSNVDRSFTTAITKHELEEVKMYLTDVKV